MNNRKLQGEIDKTLKRVGEGITEFDGILKKVYSATSTNQKEKYETDLKKEIKKLQRYRDQIKTWIGSNDVKQKNQLLEARKNIEFKMEQFKACEKDTKSRNKDTDSSKDEMAKSHVRNWVGKATTTLREQEMQFENELENIPTRKRKTEATRVEALQKYKKNHRYHYLALEHLLRKMDNDRLHHDELEGIKDSVEYYVDSYEKEENYEDPEDVYSGFNMKINGDPSGEYDFSGSDDDSDNEIDHDDQDDVIGSSDNEDKEGKQLEDDKQDNISSTTDTESIISNASTSSTSSSTNTINSNSTSTTTNSSNKTSTPPQISSNSNQPRISSPVTIQQQPNNNKPQVTPSPNLTSVNNTTANPNKKDNQKQPTPTSTPTPVPTNNPSNINFGNMSMSQRLLLQAQQAQQQQAQQQQQQQQQQISQTQQQTPQSTQLPNQIQSNQYQQPIQQGKQNYQSQPNQYQDSPDIQDQFSQMNINKQVESSEDSKNNDTFYNSGNVYNTGTLADLSSSTLSQLQQQQQVQQQQIHHHQQQQQSQQHPMMSPQQMGLPNTLSSPPQQSTQHHPNFEETIIHTRNMMDISHKNLPDYKDYERVPTYIPKSQKPTPQYYPQIPLAIFESPNIFEKFDIDTLFFIFYFKQGTYQQYQAAKELKKQGWRYHKKYLTWFRRHEEPKEITHEYEQGTYVYFDYETGWCQRKKTEFTFEYRYLEE